MATNDVLILRALLAEIGERHPHDNETRLLVDKALAFTYKDKHKAFRAPSTARSTRTMTDDDIKDVLRFALAHPDMGCREIGVVFSIDGGRVSEYLGSAVDKRVTRLRKEVLNGK